MESFFGRTKCRIIDLVALCPDAETAIRMIENYLDDYNDRHYQYRLAGLTPAEYYTYVTTGIYPCDNYFGIRATELMPVGDLVKARMEAAAEKEKKARERHKAKRAEAEKMVLEPTRMVSRDEMKLRREKSRWKKSKDLAEKQIARIDSILEKIKTALQFLVTASKEVLEELKYPQNWQKYKELDYIFDMNEMF